MRDGDGNDEASVATVGGKLETVASRPITLRSEIKQECIDTSPHVNQIFPTYFSSDSDTRRAEVSIF